jgi:hypothetical protein
MVAANSAVQTWTKEISYHNYTALSAAGLASMRTTAEAIGASVAMTEHVASYDFAPTAWANLEQELYDLLNSGHGSSFQMFAVAFPEAGYTGTKYFDINLTTWAVTITDCPKYLRSYFKYILLNATMKGCASVGGNCKGLAFENPNGTYVVVVHAPSGTSSESITISGLPAGTYGIRYSLGNGTTAITTYDHALSDQTITAGQNITFTMPSQGVATIFDNDYLGPITTTQTQTITGKANIILNPLTQIKSGLGKRTLLLS